jgi:hypothetical protein
VPPPRPWSAAMALAALSRDEQGVRGQGWVS